MELLQSTLKLARDFRATALLESTRRKRWVARLEEQRGMLWPNASESSTIVLDRRVRHGAGGLMVRGELVGESDSTSFWIKWCPSADPLALEHTHRHMAWWSSRYPQLATSISRLLDYWPDEKILLIQGVEGEPLGKSLNHDAVDRDQAVRRLARWHREYVRVKAIESRSPESLFGSEVYWAEDGRLLVRADRLVETRIELATESVDRLALAGCIKARQWADRYDLSDIVSSFASNVRAGFVHGDFKPDNILIDGESFCVIDWWTAPRISWPLADVAVFAANLWMDTRRDAARSVWHAFAATRFPDGIDARDQRGIDLLAVMTCLQYLASRATSSRSVERSYCRRVMDRLLARRQSIGHLEAT